MGRSIPRSFSLAMLAQAVWLWPVVSALCKICYAVRLGAIFCLGGGGVLKQRVAVRSSFRFGVKAIFVPNSGERSDRSFPGP